MTKNRFYNHVHRFLLTPQNNISLFFCILLALLKHLYIFARLIAGSDSPGFSAVVPLLRKAAGTCMT